jgi:hypothetical protein
MAAKALASKASKSIDIICRTFSGEAPYEPMKSLSFTSSRSISWQILATPVLDNDPIGASGILIIVG